MFGASSLAWRLYDFGLLAAISAGMFLIARRSGRFAAIWASCLLILIHARDGMREAGERDLFASALLTCGVAAFLWAKRSGRIAPAFVFGLAAGSALTVKPTFLLFCLLPIVERPQPCVDATVREGGVAGGSVKIENRFRLLWSR